MSPGVSVVICAFNSAPRLPETLRHLAAQKLPPHLAWEVLLIDNASTDDTAATALRHWPAHAPAPLRIVQEPRAGLSHARLRAIAEAQHEIISFIDDDNWISPGWIERVQGIFAAQPQVGICGGRVEAVLETPPPFWFEPLQGYFAIGRQHPLTGDVTGAFGTLLFGAGLSLRTDAARRLLSHGFTFLLAGRKGRQLTAGEDAELCFALRASGWRVWYDDDLVLQHFIPTGRLRWDYALRLMRGMGASSPLITLYLLALRVPPFDGYPAWKKSWLFQFLKVLLSFLGHFLRHPVASVRQPEGSRAALEFVQLAGCLGSLWSFRHDYARLYASIQHSAWAQTKSTPGA